MPDTNTLDPVVLADVLRVASAADFEQWREQIRRTGGCSNPIHLTGWSVVKDKTTGQVLHHTDTGEQPGGRLRVACGNRRASRCQPCAYLYAGDAYRIIRAGLAGDDAIGIRQEVREHPRVFLTLTAPSFGRVHNIPDTGARCRCGTHHAMADPALGTPLDPETYDYAGAVLFNNHAGELWHRFINRLRRELATRAGITQTAFRETARLTFAKVAEFQDRGAIHFHAVIRLDGPDGPDSAPPSWATLDLLTDAIRAARKHPYTAVTVPARSDQPTRVLRWGIKDDVRPIKAFGTDDVSEGKVAAYVAKYATKAAETTGTLDRRIGELTELDRAHVPEHARRLIRACHDLNPLYPDRKLWQWAHMLGFRGHFLTKSRAYSTTFGERRGVRADYRAAQQREHLGLPDLDTTLVLAHWQYAGHGHTPGESALAASIAHDIALNRETAREELLDQRASEGAAA
ncbi:replication initiation protein [Streptomyces sp. TRM66268-LWL]|uniref:Replication initiation protein n=1 Tax=Streptomyces polyasparticus TaxID=2767826 RepID=A0ABR7SRB4_9ACTN|nr:replication initiator protein RepSA [Streptomyces polyasparticus]MBC9716858.1 replication initiation protein [Streptomyces polyasparticus]